MNVKRGTGGIDEADETSELMMTGEALHEAMVDREGTDEVVSEYTEGRTQAFV
ncbi:hypothetical protein C464_03185 [Halorubrum coriense DSM 10284]|uniref:Uncharacterized protein n=1 Tax=Halorubrum coriense DSM 10284 TaxID=1227466 RepID=M0EQN0_9EURY|nr:hypothetical protein C464_03185 [Halorubrum coriense DSM 10284]